MPYQIKPIHSRAEALEDLEHFLALVLDATPDDDLRNVAIRQFRHDLHVLGVTSEDLDAAGIKERTHG